MSRSSRKRTSRALIGVLVVTIVLGSVFYFRSRKSPATAEAASTGAVATAEKTEKAPADANIAPKKIEETKPAEPAPVVTVTPTGPAFTKPLTEKVALATPTETKTPTAPVAAAPTTKPSVAPTAAPAIVPPTVAVSNGPVPTLVEAKAKLDAGQILLARNAYNAALVSGKLSAADTKVAKDAMMEISKTVVFSPRRFTEDTFGGTYVVKSGDRMQKIAANNNVTWEFLCKINGLSDPRKMRSGQTLKLVKGPFHAVVSKSTFMMDIYLGSPGGPDSMYVTSFPVGLGRDDSTPTGTWEIEPNKKIKNPTYFSPRGEGVIDADDPKNPLGEFWLGLIGVDGHAVGKESYGIHGTIEPDSIGKMASMGCIRLVNENVAQVFDMLVEGKSTVVVKE